MTRLHLNHPPGSALRLGAIPEPEVPAGGEKTDALGVPVVSDQRGPAIRALAESDRERYHWRGRHPEFPEVVFLFETVIDDGEHWAIRHLERHTSGRVLRYWWKHLEDRDGFLAEGTLRPEEWGLERLTEAEFATTWASGTASGIVS